ncbi:hypothetical protein P171DRAFT_280358 [Karstenula rhodostoma CBS 690.94]|uniref:Secreted protein n=1 Tax=Karstenula rhodostoma CBS 690.94 TaxID=1392251 RepID=A0A9P4PK60_9PLEO|nr:hypothetical protein P171DRAFT_280358 [Karstenula rhodostoma CBS 690.94]
MDTLPGGFSSILRLFLLFVAGLPRAAACRVHSDSRSDPNPNLDINSSRPIIHCPSLCIEFLPSATCMALV